MRRRKLGKAFGLLLRDLRKSRGLSQEKLAERAGIHATHVGLIERGERNPSLDVAASLAEALGMKLSELLREAEHRPHRSPGS